MYKKRAVFMFLYIVFVILCLFLNKIYRTVSHFVTLERKNISTIE